MRPRLAILPWPRTDPSDDGIRCTGSGRFKPLPRPVFARRGFFVVPRPSHPQRMRWDTGIALPALALMSSASDNFSYRPIAFVRSPYARRIDAPHQSTVVAGTESGDAAVAVIEFAPDIPAAAFLDLAGFERIW